jgi:Ca-activated chloride channel family protein
MIRVALPIIACGLLLVPVQDRPTFRSTSRIVPIYATVQSRDGRLVADLTRDEFRVFEDGEERRLTVFDNAPQKITVAVMFDMSGSMAQQYMHIRRAADALVAALWPDDRARIGTIGGEPAISPLLTSDKAVLRRVIEEELWPGGPTPLWSAADRAMTSLNGEAGRRVVMLFTDGDDAPSPFVGKSDLATATHHAEQGGFLIYAVGFPGRALSAKITSLADSTGGGHFTVHGHDDLPSTFARVMDELHHQYVLGFPSDLADGRVHAVDLQTTRANTKVRARRSYVAVTTGAVR